MKPISNLLFYLTRIASFSFLLTTAYGLISFVFKTKKFQLTKDAENFQINLPFSDSPFLLGQNSASAIWEMILGIMLYGLFFWLLSNVFNVFRQPKLFTTKNVNHLTIFYAANFIIPVVMLLFLLITGTYTRSFMPLALMHLLLGIFICFMTVIFKRGLHLQNDHDLYI